MITEISAVVGAAVAVVGVAIKLVELDSGKRAEMLGWVANAGWWTFFIVGFANGVVGIVAFATSTKPIDRPSVLLLLVFVYTCFAMIDLSADHVQKRRRAKEQKQLLEQIRRSGPSGDA